MNIPWSDLRSLFSMARKFGSVWCARYLGAKVRRVPLVYLDCVDRCNSHCRSCDIWRIRQGSPPELTTEEILSLRPALRRLRTDVISIGGGEPTLRDDLETIIAAFREDGLAVHMNTNGLAITEARARSLAEAGLSVIYISCDHPDPAGYRRIRGIDGLKRVEATVKHFRSLPKPVPLGINTVVSRLNQDCLERLAARCIEWGVQKAQFIPIHTHLQHREMDPAALAPLLPKPQDMPAIKARLRRATVRLRESGIETNSSFFIDHFERAYEPVRSVPCLAGTLLVMINPFGYVVPCYQQDKRFSIREAPLDEIIQSRGFQEQRKCVAGCSIACWDAGTAETSIRFHLPYLLRHSLETYREARMHIG